MVPSRAVEMRIATTVFQLRGEKQERHKSDSNDNPLSQGLENCWKQVCDGNEERLMDVLLFQMGRRGTVSGILGQRTPLSPRGTVGLADPLHGIDTDTPLPTCLGMPPAPNSTRCMPGWQLGSTMRKAEFGPYFEG